MLRLVTGVPGSGKTSSTLARYKDSEKKIFYRGIRDLSPDLGWTELQDEDLQRWPEILKSGSVLIVDEAQDIWPSTSRALTPALEAFPKHRHLGVDIELITQHPSMLHSYLRRVSSEHIHYERAFGSGLVTTYHCGTGSIDPDKPADKKRCDKKTGRLPKQVWDLYHSADEHTHKLQIPRAVYFLGVAVIIAIAAWWLFWGRITDKVDQSEPAQEMTENGTAAYANYGPSIATPADRWSHLTKNAVPGIPYTAPLYSAQATTPQSVPRIHGCMSFRADQRDCSCHTEQGTRILDMPLQMCQRILKYGHYDHLLAMASNDSQRSPGDAIGGQK